MEATVVAVLRLSVDKHAEALFEGQGLVVSAFHLLAEGTRHAHQVESVELVKGGGAEHADLLVSGNSLRRAGSGGGEPGWTATTSAEAGGRARSSRSTR